MNTVSVVFDIPLDTAFTYRIPPGEEPPLPGSRVFAPFGRRRAMGWVVAGEDGGAPAGTLKQIVKVFDPRPLIPTELLDLATEVARDTFSSRGQVLAAMTKYFPRRWTPEGEMPIALSPPAGGFREEQFLFGDAQAKQHAYCSFAGNPADGSVLFLVPELERVRRFAGVFQAVFGDRLLLFHGDLSGAERAALWLRMMKERGLIVVGTRPAVFAPLSDLRLIVVDEATESGHEERQSPRYRAPDVARLRAQRRGISFFSGAFALSVAAYRRTTEESLPLTVLPESARVLPPVLLQMLRKATRDKILPFFTRDVRSLVEETLLKGERVVLIHNRKGSGGVLVCGACDERLVCAACSGMLYPSEDGKRAVCVSCGGASVFSATCPVCGKKRVTARGFGLDRVRKMLAGAYPDMPIALITAGRSRDVPPETRFILATQAVGPVLAGIEAGLVVVLNGDLFLTYPDYRAEERFFLFVVRLLRDAKSRVIPAVIQTANPERMVYTALRNGDPESFYRKELKLRKELDYPPFRVLLRVNVEGDGTVFEQRRHVAEEALLAAGCDIFADGEERARGRMRRWKYAVKLPLSPAGDALTALAARRGISLEVDPGRL